MKSPVSAEISAKAALTVKGEIPKQSLGRLTDAITDIFRPFSEARGLKADQIRLQREEVAIEIAKRARAKLSVENTEPSPVDSKILIPLIEKSSLEDINDEEMIERWSILLANAASRNNIEPRFIQILSELSSDQAKLFSGIMRYKSENDLENRNLLDAPLNLEAWSVWQKLNYRYGNRKLKFKAGEVHDEAHEILNVRGSFIIDVIVSAGEDMWSDRVESNDPRRAERLELNLEILDSLGVLRRSSLNYNRSTRESISLIYYHATEIGVSFFLAVEKMRKQKPPT